MLLTAGTLALLLAPQGGPDSAVARFELAGDVAWVTADDLALELARRYQKTERGRIAVSHLVDLHLVRVAATARHLMPPAAEIRALAQRTAADMRAAGRDFEQFLAERNWSSIDEFSEFLALGLAHQNLVRDELGLPGDAPVSADMQTLWVRQARDKAGVVEDPEHLPDGYVARVGDDLIGLLELGRLLSTTSGTAEREQFIRQIVVLRCLNAEADANSIIVTEEEARAEVQARSEAADRDARYGGVQFEQVLLSQGLTAEALARWPVLRAQIIERKLVDLEHSPEDLQRMLDENRDEILKAHGPRRQLGIVFSSGREDLAAAESFLNELRDRIVGGELPFAAAAQRHSQDAGTRALGGAAGWHRLGSRALPEPVLEAAFALPRNGVSDPVRTEFGCYLVRVADIEPVPDDEVLLERLHQDLETALRQRILEAARMELL